MTSSPKVSVIIPVYNVSSFLARLWDRICDQTLGGVEWIFVDDGSTDDSLTVLEQFRSKASDVKVISQPNCGQGVSRNAGIHVASGEYIGFLDPDDMFSGSMFSELYAEAQRLDLDVCVCSYNYIDSATGKTLSRRTHWESGTYKGLVGRAFDWRDISDELFFNQRTCWNKIYRRQWLLDHDITFSEDRMYEDSLFYFLAMYHARRIGFIDKRLYNYQVARAGACSARPELALSFGNVSEKVWREFNKRGVDGAYQGRFLRYVLVRAVNLRERLTSRNAREFDRSIRAFFRTVEEGGLPVRSALISPTLRTLGLFGRLYRLQRRLVRRTRYLVSKLSRLPYWVKRLSGRTPLLPKPEEGQRIQERYEQVKVRLAYRQSICPSPIRVGFLVRESDKWTSSRLFEVMEQDPCFEPLIVLSVHRSVTNTAQAFHRTTMDDNAAFFEARGFTCVEAFDAESNGFHDLRSFSLDLLFYDQPYGLPAMHRPENVASSMLTAYIPYGYGIYLFDETMQLTPSFLSCLWAVYLETDEFLADWDRSGLPAGPQYEFTGYPKMDDFRGGPFPSHGADEHRMTVIYAPHHSVDKGHPYPLATFQWSGRWMLEYARRRPDVDWVFKPHPKLRHALITSGLMTPDEVDRYFASWEELPGSKVLSGGDYFDEFRHSDVMVTDCGSFLVEYLFTGKPLVRLVNGGAGHLSGFAQRFMEYHYEAESIAQAQSCLDSLLCGDDRFGREERLKLVGSGAVSASERVRESLARTFSPAGSDA